jgi:uncharacterized membrane protein
MLKYGINGRGRLRKDYQRRPKQVYQGLPTRDMMMIMMMTALSLSYNFMIFVKFQISTIYLYILHHIYI